MPIPVTPVATASGRCGLQGSQGADSSSRPLVNDPPQVIPGPHPMTFIFVACLLSVLAYVFLIVGPARGRLFVRSALFLDALRAGRSVAQANDAVASKVLIESTEAIAFSKAFLQARGGKQLPIIAEARSSGMVDPRVLGVKTFGGYNTETIIPVRPPVPPRSNGQLRSHGRSPRMNYMKIALLWFMLSCSVIGYVVWSEHKPAPTTTWRDRKPAPLTPQVLP